MGADMRRGPAGPETIDGEYKAVDPEDGAPPGDSGWTRVPGERRGR